MELISDIINELVDADRSINSPLLKTKVLASRLQNEDLLEWVTKELKGYDDKDDLPSYRVYKGSLIGAYVNGSAQYSHQPIPVVGLNEGLIKKIKTMIFFQSVSSIENLKVENESGVFLRMLAAELIPIIEKNFIEMGNPYLHIVSCNLAVGSHVVTEILSAIRNNLLDFMLKIDSEFGNLTKLEELKTKDKEIQKIMHKTIINNSGDGSTINTGSSNQLNSASGNNIDQDILGVEQKNEIEELITKIRTVLEESEFEEKEDAILEIQRVENQLKKENPKKTIIVQSLETIQSFLTSVTANAWTPSILKGIKNLLSSM